MRRSSYFNAGECCRVSTRSHPWFSSTGPATRSLRTSLLSWSFHSSTLAWWMVQHAPYPAFPALTLHVGACPQHCEQPGAEPNLSTLPADYGIKPKQPRLRTQVGRKRPEWLQRAGKSKRDELDLQEYYDDAHL